MNIIEKLEILPIERGKNIPDENSVSVNIDDLDELEQQRNEILEALKNLMKGVDKLPPLTAIEGLLTEQWKVCIDVIEKATGKSWEEIKELYHEGV